MSLPHLILGALRETPSSGYDLDKRFQESIGHFWTTDRSQIYRTLHRLERDGLVRLEVVRQEDHPDKKVYYVTEAGEAALRAWLVAPLPEYDMPVREGWLGQLFFGERLDNATLLALLEDYRVQVQAAVDTLQAIRAGVLAHLHGSAISRRGRLRLLTLDYGIVVQGAYVRWLEQAMDEIRAWPDDAPSTDGGLQPDSNDSV